MSQYKSKNGNTYLVKGNHADIFVATPAFQQWMDNLHPEIKMSYLELRDAFVIKEKIMLFATVLGVNATLNRRPINAFAFLRSDAVAMLPIIKERKTGNIFTIATEQFRFPYGKVLFECPAGMLNNEGFTGAAAREIEEELHEKISSDRLLHLGATVMSGGGCPEKIHYVAFEMEKSKDEIEDMRGRKTGEAAENEDIILHVLPFNTNLELLLALEELNLDLDAKMLCAIVLWNKRKEMMWLAKTGE